MATRATSGDKHLRYAVIGHRHERSERQRATQFFIESQCSIAYWHFYPARVGILFILVADILRHTAGYRGQTVNTCTQRLLFQRFTNLLAQYFINRTGLSCIKKPPCTTQGKKGEIRSDGQQEKWGYDCVRVQHRKQLRAGGSSSAQLPVVACKNVLVDEALPSECDIEPQARHVRYVWCLHVRCDLKQNMARSG